VEEAGGATTATTTMVEEVAATSTEAKEMAADTMDATTISIGTTSNTPRQGFNIKCQLLRPYLILDRSIAFSKSTAWIAIATTRAAPIVVNPSVPDRAGTNNRFTHSCDNGLRDQPIVTSRDLRDVTGGEAFMQCNNDMIQHNSNSSNKNKNKNKNKPFVGD